MTSSPSTSITAKLVTGTWWNMAWRVITRGLGFVSLILLAQILAPSDIGIVAIATSIVGVIDSLSHLGVREALIRLKDQSDEMYDTAFTIQVARSALTATVLGALSVVSTPWVGDARVQAVLVVLAASALIGGFENMGYVRIQREMNFRAQFTLQLVPRLLSFICTIAIAIIFRTYWAIIVGGIIARLSGVVLTYFVYPYRARFRLVGWRYLLRFSLWTWVAGIAIAVWSRSDPFVIGPYIGTAGLGVYMLAMEIGMLPISELLDPICATLFPGFAKAKDEGTHPAHLALEVATGLSFLTMPFALALSACSGYLVPALLGPKWSACQAIIAIITWGCVFSPFSYVAATALSVEGQVKMAALSNVAASTIKIAALVIVRETHDMTLIAAAAVCVIGAESAIFIAQLRRIDNSPLQPFFASMARAILALGGCAALLWTIPGTWALVPNGRLSALVIGSAIGAATFVAFWAFLLSLWTLAGTPPGAEERIFAIFRHHIFGKLMPQRS